MQVTKTVWLFAHPYNGYNFDTHQDEKRVVYSAWPYETYDKLEPVGSAEVTFTIDNPLDYYELKLKELEAAKKALQAEFTAKLTEIQAQINEHLAIEAQ